MQLKVSALESEKVTIEKTYQLQLHEAEKKIVKLSTQVKMGGHVFSAMQMGMTMANKAAPFQSPAVPPSSGSSGAGSSSDGAASKFKSFFEVASPD